MKNQNQLSDYYKVPFRQVYCETLRTWVMSCFRCHVWLQLFGVNLPEIG